MYQSHRISPTILRLALITSFWWCGCAVVQVGAPEPTPDPSTARSTVLLAPKRPDGRTKDRTGRPRLWDNRFERRVLRFARWNPKMTYKDMKDQLDTLLFKSTLRRILQDNGISNWLSKKRPYLTKEVVKKRLT
jgi:hypothetical protein